MAEKQEFEHESIQDCETIQAYLNALTEGFESGKIVFNSEKKELVLTPGDLLSLAIKAKKKGAKNKVTLKFSWKDAGTPVTAADFKISSEKSV